MKFKIKSFSRLTIIFILAVTIPGSILSYLSIQNITNLKELMERRVLEEQESLADLVCQKFHDNLDDINKNFSDHIPDAREVDFALIRYSDTLDFIENPFIIDHNGTFLWPLFLEDLVAERGSSSNIFYNQFSSAESYEFFRRNYTEAIVRYQRALTFATGKTDSAQVINALARTYFKSNNARQAVNQYVLLLTQYYNVIDRNGLPYLNYGIPQLLKLSDTTNTDFILTHINFILSKMLGGGIPLNYSTPVLLDDMSEWMNNNPSVMRDEKTAFESAIRELRTRIHFITRNGSLLQDFISSSRKINSIPIGDGIHSVSVFENRQSIIIFETDSNFNCGFTLNLDSLSRNSILIDIPSDYRFEYGVELYSSNAGPGTASGELITTTILSQLSPDKSILIKLKDEQLLQRQVYRTSWLYGVAIILLIGGMILGVFLIIRDINRERHLSRLRSEFVSNVTHELKTPLTSIYMFAESILLGRVKTRSDQKEYLGIILKETERLKRLINNILDFSKREKGKLVYNFIESNISELVQSAVHDLDYWTIEKEFKVETDIDDDIIGKVDPDALKQAIINLISNAIKYSSERKEILVRLWKDGKSIFIEVEDKGIGIPEEKQDLIFDKFYRIESSEAPENTGTGLGLTVVKDIVEAHSASITVKSIPGQGSTFTIVLSV